MENLICKIEDQIPAARHVYRLYGCVTAAGNPEGDIRLVDTDLHTACNKGNLFQVKDILSQGQVGIDSKGRYGWTAVMLAANWGHGDIFNTVMNRNPDVSVLDLQGNTILHLACYGGDMTIVTYVLSHKMADINSKNHLGETPVMRAASCGHKDIFFSLLYKHHADISLGDNAGKNILHWACCGGNIAIVNHVLSSKIVHIDYRDHGGMTPAMVAEEKGRKNVLDFLIKEGADLSLKDSFSNDAYQRRAQWTWGHARRGIN